MRKTSTHTTVASDRFWENRVTLASGRFKQMKPNYPTFFFKLSSAWPLKINYLDLFRPMYLKITSVNQ